MKRVAVLQSNYLPWKGYFDIIHDVDIFIFYDDLQYTKNDWRNRNKVVTPNGLKWLTIPVGTNKHRLVIDVVFTDGKWQKDHFNKICTCYEKAPFFKTYENFFKEIYLGTSWKYLYELNRYLIKQIACEFLGIKTKFADSRDFEAHGIKHEKLLNLLISADCTTYVSGPAAKNYIIEEDYKNVGIEIVWKDYSGYPEYPQIGKTFEPYVSIIDLLFNVGPAAPYYIWGWRNNNTDAHSI
ncbi:WbqC family protein [Treponema primitia]|uniref:WbqC family protein n=1 Tax=Treponema primitia TaxID=88058 RepID=UPI0002554EE5|nr:WbqC family protein [Treponema primitia]